MSIWRHVCRCGICKSVKKLKSTDTTPTCVGVVSACVGMSKSVEHITAHHFKVSMLWSNHLCSSTPAHANTLASCPYVSTLLKYELIVSLFIYLKHVKKKKDSYVATLHWSIFKIASFLIKIKLINYHALIIIMALSK